MNIKKTSLTYRYLTAFKPDEPTWSLPTTTCGVFGRVFFTALLLWGVAFVAGSAIFALVTQLYMWYDAGMSGNVFALMSAMASETDGILWYVTMASNLTAFIVSMIALAGLLLAAFVAVILFIVADGTIGLPNLMRKLTGKRLSEFKIVEWMSMAWAVITGKLCIPVKYEK
jgi:hypothetical protein